MTARLNFSQVSREYTGVRALQSVSFQLRPGEVIGILGHNGAGKTTTMKLALGIIAPTEGQVRVMDEDPRGRNSDRLRRNIGYLPENVSFYQQLSGREVLNYFARLKGVPVEDVQQLLDQVGLSDAADRRIRTYSKGMRQRVGLAQALLGRPRLLLLDEPTAGLDPQATREFYSLVDSLRAEGVSILISSHVLPGVERHIDRAIIMSHGQLRAEGSLDALRAQAQLPLTVRAYTDVEGHADLSEHELERMNYHVKHQNGKSIELEGPVSHKLDAVRLLVNTPGVIDLEIIQPSLDSLYAHFNRAPAERVEQS